MRAEPSRDSETLVQAARCVHALDLQQRSSETAAGHSVVICSAAAEHATPRTSLAAELWRRKRRAHATYTRLKNLPRALRGGLVGAP